MIPLTPLRTGRPSRTLALAVSVAVAVPVVPSLAAAQTLDDGLTVARHELRTSFDLATDRWDRYWEGAVLRNNGNIGTLTTNSVTATLTYGATRSLMLVASLPYVWTNASEGVLAGQHGLQDATVAAKLRVLRVPLGERFVLGANVVGGVAAPTSDYTPDFLPMSIGLGSRRAIARASLHLKDRSGFYLDGSLGHTWRSTVTLSRPAYYTDGSLTLSDEVAMPDVSDWMAGLGFLNDRWCIPVGVSGQRTLGGGDIRRQDMPFLSNRMNFTKAHAMVMYTLPVPSRFQLGVGAARTLAGRNVGRSTMLSVEVAHVARF